MAARGTVVRPVDFQLPVLQIPFEQLYAQMQQFQLEKDTFEQFQGLMPNYLQEDTPYAQQYKGLVENLSGTVSKSFAEGKTSDAMRALRRAQGEVKRHWQPGGIAHGLQQRYVAAQEAVKKIEEHTKDFRNPDYRQFYQDRLQQQISKGMGYDPVSGSYNPISTPEMQAEVIVGEELDKFLTNWKPDINTSIYKGPDGFWYTKETNERVSAGELQRATAEFMRQPHVQYANSVSAWAATKNIPPQMREQVTQAYRQEMNLKLSQALEQQRQAYRSLEKAASTGKKEDALNVQRQLNQMGYQVAEDGIVGTETRTALEQLKRETEAELQQMEQQGKLNIGNMTLQQLQLQKTEERLTDQYVPKHAYSVRELDLIANQPALIMLRHRLQKEALNGLKAILAPPTNTLWAPQSTSPLSFGSIADQYKTSKKTYDQMEAGQISALPPEWQAQLRLVGPNAAVAASKMATAAQAAMASGYFNPSAYEQSLKQQGVNLSPVELGENLRLVQGARGRELVQGISDNLMPAHQQTEVYQEMYQQLSEQALKSKDVDWNAIANSAGIGDYVKATHGPGFFKGNAATAKQRFEQGDPKAINAFNEWFGKQSPLVKGKMVEGVRENYAFINESLKGFQDQVTEVVKSAPASFFNYNVMSKAEREQLGMDKHGNLVVDEKGVPKVKIEHVGLGATMINGRSVPAVMIKTSSMTAPVPVSMDRLNGQWVETMLKNGAAAAMNPNDPSKITDPTSFNSFAAMLFDVQQKPGTAFDAAVIMGRTKQPGSVGMSYIRTPQGVHPIQSFVIKGPEGLYLVTTSDQAEAEKYRNNPTVQNSDELNQSKGIAIPMGSSYTDVNSAILSTKAYLNTPILLEDLRTNPYQVQLQRNNVTAHGAEALMPFMQYIMSTNQE